MRIAVPIDHMRVGKGGLEAWLSALGASLAERGHEVVLLTMDREVAGWPHERKTIAVHARTRARADREFAERCREESRSGAYDVCLGLRHCLSCDVYAPHGGSVAASFAARGRFGALRLRLSPKVRTFLALERELLQGESPPTVVVAVSQAVRADLSRRFPGVADRIRVVPNGVDLQRFTPEGREAARRRLVPEGGGVLLFAAGNPRLKGWKHARRLFSVLRSSGVSKTLLVAGARPKGRTDGIRWLGRLDRPEEAMRAADLLLLPTYHDPFPLTVLEALACGTPVLTTERNGAVVHLGREGPIAVVAEPEDVDAMAPLARDLLARAPRAEARALAERFPLGRCLGEMERILVEAAGRKEADRRQTTDDS